MRFMELHQFPGEALKENVYREKEQWTLILRNSEILLAKVPEYNDKALILKLPTIRPVCRANKQEEEIRGGYCIKWDDLRRGDQLRSFLVSLGYPQWHN